MCKEDFSLEISYWISFWHLCRIYSFGFHTSGKLDDSLHVFADFAQLKCQWLSQINKSDCMGVVGCTLCKWYGFTRRNSLTDCIRNEFLCIGVYCFELYCIVHKYNKLTDTQIHMKMSSFWQRKTDNCARIRLSFVKICRCLHNWYGWGCWWCRFGNNAIDLMRNTCKSIFYL